MKQLNIWAHRGASAYAPENTMEAFKLAIEQQADGIEINIHHTKDGEIVVIHDDTIDRTSNGKGEVSSFTLAELKSFNFNAGFEDKYGHAEIPTLSQVLELAKETGLHVSIQENVLFTDEDRSELSLAAADLIRKLGMEDSVSFASFNHRSLATLKKYFPTIQVGAIYLEDLYNGGQYAKTFEASALHSFYMGLNSRTIEQAHTADVTVHAWTVNEVVGMVDMINLGVDVLITDCPDVAVQLRTMNKEALSLLDDEQFRASFEKVRSFSFMQSLYAKMAKNQVQEG